MGERAAHAGKGEQAGAEQRQWDTCHVGSLPRFLSCSHGSGGKRSGEDRGSAWRQGRTGSRSRRQDDGLVGTGWAGPISRGRDQRRRQADRRQVLAAGREAARAVVRCMVTRRLVVDRVAGAIEGHLLHAVDGAQLDEQGVGRGGAGGNSVENRRRDRQQEQHEKPTRQRDAAAWRSVVVLECPGSSSHRGASLTDKGRACPATPTEVGAISGSAAPAGHRSRRDGPISRRASAASPIRPSIR